MTPQVFLRKLLLNPSNHVLVQLIRYGMVVAIAFPIDIGLLYVFTAHLHFFYILSATLAFTISMAVNYMLSVRWVFTARTAHGRWIEAGTFFAIGFVGLAITDFFMWIFTSVIGLHFMLSKLIVVMIVFFWSFGARRFMFHSPRFKKMLDSII